MRTHVVVIGAGVFGAWTAHHLLLQGHQVTLIDAWGPAHSRASSGGESRMTRGAYGKDEIYTRMSLDSLPQWEELSAASGLPIFIRNGVLFFFHREEPYFRETLAAHARLGLPTEALDQRQLMQLFPMIDFDGISVGLFEPGFGALMARRAIITLVERFVREGGAYRLGSAVAPESASTKLAEIELTSGEVIAADFFVFALGAWLPKLFPNVIDGRIRATRQEVFFFSPPGGEPHFSPNSMPCWADFNEGDMFYGFPDLESRGVKFAHDAHGPEVDPDSQDRLPTVAALERIVAYRDRRFPLLKNAPLTEARVCQYENSSNGDLLIDLHPDWPNVLLLGAGSGHGFKHGPEVGRYASARLLGSIKAEPRFSLESKTRTHQREIH